MKNFTPFCRRLITSLFLFTIAASSWAYDFVVNGIYYNKTSENTVEVTCLSSWFVNGNYTNKNAYSGYIVIPSSVTYSGKKYSVTSIDGGAFRGCSALKSVTIPNSVTSIGDEAFQDCSVLTSVIIPNSVTRIEERAFLGCSALESVTIPNSITRIEKYVFQSCSNLTSIIIPNSVTSIGWQAFYDCSNLTSVTIPNSVISIDGLAFSRCTKITDFFIDTENPSYSYQDGMLLNKTGSKYIATIGNPTSAIIPESITSIGSYAFYDCSALTSITIPNSVTSIGSYAFDGCSALTSITIPNSVTNIMEGAFIGCDGLKEFYFLSDKALSYLKKISSSTDFHVYVPYKNIDEARQYYTGELYPVEEFYPDIIEKTLYSIKFKIAKTPHLLEENIQATQAVALKVNDVDRDIKASIFVIECEEPYTENTVCIKYETGSANTNAAHGAVNNPIYKELYFTLVPKKFDFSIENIEMKQGRLGFKVALDDIFHVDYETGVVLDGLFYKADTDSIAVINNLIPETQYTIAPCIEYKGELYWNDSHTYRTAQLNFSTNVSSTQCSLSLKPQITNLDGTAQPEGLGIAFNGTNYPYNGSDIKILGLTPYRSYYYQPYAEFNGKRRYGSGEYTSTKGVLPNIYVKTGPTTLSLQGSYTLGDATLDKAYFSGYEDQGEKLQISGLIPGKTYSYTFYVKTKEGSTESITKSFTTPALEWETLPAEATSNTVALICAKTNIADEETGTGFEWRRYDAPDLVPSTKAPCPVVDGVLTGALRNLSANTYYKFRPYYTSATGETYYGDWLAFGTADAYVYFDPTVRTYEASTVSHNSAKLKGYAIAGSDDIVEQGFEYRTTGRSTAPLRILTTNAEGDDVQSVTATGQWMNVTLENLQPGTTYTYRAYVKTAKATTYGEEQSFTTMEVSGIGDMEISEDVTITAIYTLDGRRIASLQPGVNIVHYSNGSVRKMIVK